MRPPTPPRTFAVDHHLTHTVASPVPAAYARVLLRPRAGAGQTVHRAELTVSPAARETAEFADIDGNRMTYLHVSQPHRQLDVHAASVVSVVRRPPRAESVPQHPWDRVVGAVREMRATGQGDQGEGPAAVLGIVSAALPSELVEPDDAVLDFALASFRPGMPLLTAVAALAGRTSAGFTVRPRPFDGNLSRVLAERTGADEDITHLVCASLRAIGLAARYVSGYRYVPGSTASACRSWAAVWLPGGGWIHVDPVTGRLVDDSYVILGWGRDARDVAPMRGLVLSTGSGSRMTEHAALTPVAAEELVAGGAGRP